MTLEIPNLPLLTTKALAERHLQLVGQPVRTRHKAYLIRKIAWRMQALAEGDLTERARKRAAELANDADVRLMPPKPRLAAVAGPGVAGPGAAAGATRVLKAPAASPAADPRLPAPGAAIVRQYKGRQVR